MTMTETIGPALRVAERELAHGVWTLDESDIAVVEQVLEPLHALAHRRAARPGPQPDSEHAHMLGDALASLATGAVTARGPLARLLAQTCNTLEPLICPRNTGTQGRWHRPPPAWDPGCSEDAEQVLMRLRSVLGRAKARPPTAPGHEAARETVRRRPAADGDRMSASRPSQDLWIQEPPTVNESHPPAFVSLPDGRVLAGPATTTPDMLTVGAWIDVAGRPAQIRDLRLRAGGGRIAHLARHRPVSFGQHDPVTVYTLVQPSTRRGLA